MWQQGRSWSWDLLPQLSSLKRLGSRFCGGQAVEPVEEGPPLSPLGPGLMEVDGTKQAPKDGAMVGEAADKETDSSLQLS